MTLEWRGVITTVRLRSRLPLNFLRQRPSCLRTLNQHSVHATIWLQIHITVTQSTDWTNVLLVSGQTNDKHTQLQLQEWQSTKLTENITTRQSLNRNTTGILPWHEQCLHRRETAKHREPSSLHRCTALDCNNNQQQIVTLTTLYLLHSWK